MLVLLSDRKDQRPSSKIDYNISHPFPPIQLILKAFFLVLQTREKFYLAFVRTYVVQLNFLLLSCFLFRDLVWGHKTVILSLISIVQKYRDVTYASSFYRSPNNLCWSKFFVLKPKGLIRTYASSFYRSQNVLRRSNFFEPVPKFDCI